MRLWRNRQTRTFEGRVVNTVRVQVSSVAPESLNPSGFSAFYISRACSSPGRALRSQRRGREFESLQVHQMDFVRTPFTSKEALQYWCGCKSQHVKTRTKFLSLGSRFLLFILFFIFCASFFFLLFGIISSYFRHKKSCKGFNN